jgi:HSP20 family protein
MTGFNSTLARSLGPARLSVTGREMDELFERLFVSGAEKPASNGNTPTRNGMPPLSIWEQGDRFYLEMELPGFKREELDVTFEAGQITVTAKRSAAEHENRKYLHQERSWSEVSRTLSIHDSLDPESIVATLEDGVLRIELAKRPEVLPKRIEISSKD